MKFSFIFLYEYFIFLCRLARAFSFYVLFFSFIVLRFTFVINLQRCANYCLVAARAVSGELASDFQRRMENCPRRKKSQLSLPNLFGSFSLSSSSSKDLYIMCIIYRYISYVPYIRILYTSCAQNKKKGKKNKRRKKQKRKNERLLKGAGFL